MKAKDILKKSEKILDNYGADWRNSSIEIIDGTIYVVFKYYGGLNDTVDMNDDSWDEISDLDGVVDVGYGYGYGIEGEYEDSLLIELEDSIVESTKSTRKSLKQQDDYNVWAVYPSDNLKEFLVNCNVPNYQYTLIRNDKVVKHSNFREDWFANKKKKLGYRDFDENGEDEMLANMYGKRVLVTILSDKRQNESTKFSKKSLKESKKISYEEFKNICDSYSDDIYHFHEYKGAYFVILGKEKEGLSLLKYLRDEYDLSCTYYKLIDPNNGFYGYFEIMCV